MQRDSSYSSGGKTEDSLGRACVGPPRDDATAHRTWDHGRRSSSSYTTHCPQAVRQYTAGVHCPPPPGSGAVYCRRSTAHCPQAVRQCIAGVPLPTGPRQWGSVLQELHCPLPPGSEAVYCRRSTAHGPQAVRPCVAGGPLPTAPGSEAVH